MPSIAFIRDVAMARDVGRHAIVLIARVGHGSARRPIESDHH
jgi:hypothetical protein